MRLLKILAPKNSVEALNRLDTQVELTAASISRISNPAEKKKAAEKYIAKLYEVSSVLSEKQKNLLQRLLHHLTPRHNQSLQNLSRNLSHSRLY